MPISTFIPRDDLRTEFSAALSEIYRIEVPLYGDLVELVNDINDQVIKAEGNHIGEWQIADRLNVERHGAIRLGTPLELHTISRLFALLGMYPVGYYDLSTSGVPVHSTAFRPITPSALSINPFRVFTSLLRPELITDSVLREECMAILAKRKIFHPELMPLIEKAEVEGGLERDDADNLVKFALDTFRWHECSLVCKGTYGRMRRAHPLLADIAGFRGPHINHLTPRVLDIDRAQAGMGKRGIPPKDIIEGPPHRLCPILLRQTSFKALTEPILFAEFDSDDDIMRVILEEDAIADEELVPGSVGSGSGGLMPRSMGTRRRSSGGEMGTHRARFGEIESRGAALTRKGHELYLSLLAQVAVPPNERNEHHQQALSAVFHQFPDTWEEIRDQGLAYFRYFPIKPKASSTSLPLSTAAPSSATSSTAKATVEDLIRAGKVGYEPIVYEDFLPASAAGIFQSNLVESTSIVATLDKEGGATKGAQEDEMSLDGGDEVGMSSRDVFEKALGGKVADYWELYETIERESVEAVFRALRLNSV